MDNPKTLATLGIQDTGNIGHTRHWQHWTYKIQDKDKESKTKNTTQKTKMMSSTDPTQKKYGVNPDAHRN